MHPITLVVLGVLLVVLVLVVLELAAFDTMTGRGEVLVAGFGLAAVIVETIGRIIRSAEDDAE